MRNFRGQLCQSFSNAEWNKR